MSDDEEAGIDTPRPDGDGSAACVIVYSEAGRVLMQLRAERGIKSDEGLKWGIWGGRIEAGETPRQAAKRELGEETGLEGEPEYWARGTTSRGHPDFIFTLRCDEDVVRFLDPAETVRAEWFSIRELGRRRSAYGHGDVVMRFLASRPARPPGAR